MNKNPLVSVVIPTFNRAGTIRRAVLSVLNQSYHNLELIVVDDASTDCTADVLAEIEDPRMKVICHKKNKGVAGALNTGARAAKADFIAFQDSDDEWLDAKLTEQMEHFLATDAACVCIYCIKIVYGRDNAFTRGRRRTMCVPGPDAELVEGDLRQVLWRNNIISNQTIICKAEAYRSVGGFDEKLYNSVDWDFAIRLSELGTFAFVDKPLVNTYIQPDSVSTLTRKKPYSQLIINNKMKRRGVPIAARAATLARLGYRLGKLGYPKRGKVLLCAALAAQKVTPRNLAKYVANQMRIWKIV